jgi:transcriptional regulator with XRE-family HTH domain
MKEPLFVKTLFALLRIRGVSQQAVARALGVSKTTVSFWAHGRDPLPNRYEHAFLDLVADAAAWPPESSEDYHPLSLNQMIEYKTIVGQYIQLWAMERQHRRGALAEDYRQSMRIIASYAAVDPAKLEPAQLLEIQQASHTLARASRILGTLQQPPPVTNGPMVVEVSKQGLRTALQQIADQGYLTAPAEDEENET